MLSADKSTIACSNLYQCNTKAERDFVEHQKPTNEKLKVIGNQGN